MNLIIKSKYERHLKSVAHTMRQMILNTADDSHDEVTCTNDNLAMESARNQDHTCSNSSNINNTSDSDAEYHEIEYELENSVGRSFNVDHDSSASAAGSIRVLTVAHCVVSAPDLTNMR